MPCGQEVIISTICRNVSKTYGVYINFCDVASAVKVLTISFLYSDIQVPIHTSYNMGLLKQTWRFKSFLHAQGFDLCSSSKRYMCFTHTFLLEDKQCLLKKLYLRSENDPAKEVHAVTYKTENIKDKKEHEKYQMLEYAPYYSFQVRKG